MGNGSFDCNQCKGMQEKQTEYAAVACRVDDHWMFSVSSKIAAMSTSREDLRRDRWLPSSLMLKVWCLDVGDSVERCIY